MHMKMYMYVNVYVFMLVFVYVFRYVFDVNVGVRMCLCIYDMHSISHMGKTLATAKPLTYGESVGNCKTMSVNSNYMMIYPKGLLQKGP